MGDLLLSLVPLAIGSALVPLQIVVTILLLRSPAGRATGLAWVAGMTVVRLAQGLVFGLLLEASGGEGGDERGVVASVLLLVVAVLFYVAAARKLANQPDEDAPPPRWMATLATVTPGRAFLFGMALVAVSAKLWVFTLGAIGAIGEAELDPAAAVAAFLLFVLLAESTHLAIVGLAYAAPAHADVTLARFSAWLERYTRPIMVTLGLVFGTWFLLEALDGLGIL